MTARAASQPDLAAQAKEIVEGFGGQWRDGGALCHCPAHDDRRPSLSVRIGDRSLLFKCFAGCDGVEIIRAIRAAGLVERGGLPVRDTLRRVAAVDLGRAARQLWRMSGEVDDTLGALYLAARGFVGPHPEVRYLARTPLGRGRGALYLPALLIAVRDEVGLVGVQRLFLDPTGSAKRDMPAPTRALGRFQGGAVRLAPAAERLGLAEGYETARSAMALLGLPVWATRGAERLPRIALPDVVRHVVLLPDRDRGGRVAAAKARVAYLARALTVETRWPPVGCGDWNDAHGRRRGGG